MNEMAETAARLCRLHTLLTEEEIEAVAQAAAGLQSMAAACPAGTDLFIDAPCADPDQAVVVAWAAPGASLYDVSTVGYIIREEAEPAVFRSLRLGAVTEEVKAVTAAATRQHAVVQSVRPVQLRGKTVAALIRERAYEGAADEEDARFLRRPTEDELRRAPYLRHISWLADHIHDAVIVTDAAGTVCYRNAEAARLYAAYGYTGDIWGREYRQVACHGSLPDGGSAEISIRGKYYRIEQRALSEAECRFTLTVLHDVTDGRRRQMAEAGHKAAVQEAHHRIKNSLNMVYSLLDMQRRRAGDGAAESLQQAMDRVISVAATYELAAGGDSTVPLFPLLLGIRDRFTRLALQDGRLLNITVQGGDVSVWPDDASAIALVVTELLQNCYKHAFPGRDPGNVRIELTAHPVCPSITVSDDGVGIGGAAEGMGLRIARMLVENTLRGKLDIHPREHGATVSFGFLAER